MRILDFGVLLLASTFFLLLTRVFDLPVLLTRFFVLVSFFVFLVSMFFFLVSFLLLLASCFLILGSWFLVLASCFLLLGSWFLVLAGFPRVHTRDTKMNQSNKT